MTQNKHAGKSTYENLQTIYVSIELSKNHVDLARRWRETVSPQRSWR